MSRRKSKYYLVLDLGTTGLKAFLFDEHLKIFARTYASLGKRQVGKHRVEQDPYELVDKSIAAIRKVVKTKKLGKERLAGFGLANQRETVVLWDKATGRPVHPAIVWQDNRTQKFCDGIQKRYGKKIMAKTGLPVWPYFSASKMRWILDHVPAARRLAKEDKLAIGTVDAWFLWNATSPRVHATDYTNASRTLLFDIKRLRWDGYLAKVFGVPLRALPKTLPSRADFGELDPRILGFKLAVLAMIGDQQASLFAAGTAPRTAKVTYGTGAFFMEILGHKYERKQDFFTTIAVSGKRPVFAIEAKVNKGAADVLKVLHKPAALRRTITDIAVEVGKITDKLGPRPEKLVIDGGITKYRKLPAIQRRISGLRVERQSTPNGTALGVAKLMRRREDSNL